MYCIYCGTAHFDEGTFCRKCGKRKAPKTTQLSSHGRADLSSPTSQPQPAPQNAFASEAGSAPIAVHALSGPVEFIGSTHVTSVMSAVSQAKKSVRFAHNHRCGPHSVCSPRAWHLDMARPCDPRAYA